MKAPWMILALALGQDSQPAGVAQDESGPDVTAERATPEPPSFEQELSLEEVLSAVERLTVEFPELATVETLGHSRLGHELQVVTLTDRSTGSPDEKPGLLFVDHRAPTTRQETTRGAESVLAFGWSLAHRAGEEPEIAELLAEHVVYLIPAADPDVRVIDDESSPTPAPIEFDHNFPLGWLPASLRPGSGDFPLARSETRALATFLRDHPNLVLIVGVAPGRRGEDPWPGAEFPADDRAALDALCEPFSVSGNELVPWGRLGSRGGGLFDYAYQALGIYPVAWVSERGEITVEAVAAGTIELLRRMPRMRIDPAGQREIAPGLWEVDVAISNAGVLPTLSALGARRRVAGELFLDVEGIRLVATARRHAQDQPFHSARLHPADEVIHLQGSILRGGETRWLRLVLEGEPGAVVALQGVGARAGSMRLEVELR